MQRSRCMNGSRNTKSTRVWAMVRWRTPIAHDHDIAPKVSSLSVFVLGDHCVPIGNTGHFMNSF